MINNMGAIKEIIYGLVVSIIMMQLYPNESLGYDSARRIEHTDIHRTITQGAKAIEQGRLSPVIPQREGMVPIVCGSPDSYTGNPQYLQGSCPPVVVAGRYGQGRVVALGHDGWLLAKSLEQDVAKLALNSLQWLAGDIQSPKIALYTSIGTLLTRKTLSIDIRKSLKTRGCIFTDMTEKVSKTSLADCSVLVIARPHTRLMDAAEVDMICRFVADGGGLLMAGLGWFWQKSNPTLSMEEFPLNVLGRSLGVQFLSETVWEQSETGIRLPAKFTVGEPFLWNPKPTLIFQQETTTDHEIYAQVRRHRDSHNFAIEGKRAVLNLPAEAFLKLDSPTRASKDLDLIYETHAKLAGHVPYHGRKIRFVVVDRLCFHLCSGNPILIRKGRIPVVLNDFNHLGHPGWGLLHELGHDFVASAHQHAYQLGPGDNESWANVFTRHAYDTLDLAYDPHDRHEQLQEAMTYYFTKKPNYEKLKTHQWIMLGLLMVIKEAYGWEPFYNFFAECSERAKQGRVPTQEKDKVDFLVQGLSRAAGVDLSPTFVDWGFPVSETVTQELQTMPRAELDKAARHMARLLKVPIKR
jgi:hypothetical protein